MKATAFPNLELLIKHYRKLIWNPAANEAVLIMQPWDISIGHVWVGGLICYLLFT